jgi:hypothetical protein
VNAYLRINLYKSFSNQNEPQQNKLISYLERERGRVGVLISRKAFLGLGIDREIEGRDRFRKT